MTRNGNIAACSKHSRRLPGYKHNDRHRTIKVASERRPCLFILIVTLCLVVCLSFIIDCFVAFINICFLIPNHFFVLTACQRACLGITGVPSLVSNFAKRFELTLTCLVLAWLIFSHKKRCILWPFILTSDLVLLVNNIILRLH